MAEAKGQRTEEQDPSMEEILQSIRRIIAEDDKTDGSSAAPDAAAPAVSAPPAATAPGKDLSSDVLELTEMMQDDGSTVSITPGAAAVAAPPENAPADILASIDNALGDKKPKKEPVAPPAAAPVAAAPPPPPPPPAMPAAPAAVPVADDNESILSAQAAAAASAALRKLQDVRPAESAVSTTPSMPFRSGDTVEDLAMAALRPMLKEWLDANMPAIVERVVEREVKKLREG